MRHITLNQVAVIVFFMLIGNAHAAGNVDYVNSINVLTKIVIKLVDVLYIFAALKGFTSMYSILMLKYKNEQQIPNFGLKMLLSGCMILLSTGAINGTYMSDFNLSNDFIKNLGVVQVAK
ncbi:hypothetical protein V6259_12480 [Marinomonas sp. TI.3.20]|uniref:hypothetical protein n=1 Tax=Marinomonas sp. TI.3.20 TaxID=3121296 RepID=UPI00311F1353